MTLILNDLKEMISWQGQDPSKIKDIGEAVFVLKKALAPKAEKDPVKPVRDHSEKPERVERAERPVDKKAPNNYSNYSNRG